MESMDRSQEAEVWKRVFAPAPAGGTLELKKLLVAAGEQMGFYRWLMGIHPEKERLKKLYDGERTDMACLRGMCLLSGDAARQPPLMPGKQAADKALAQCYHRARRMAGEYTARIADPEFGMVFEELAKRQRERCVALLGILGGN